MSDCPIKPGMVVTHDEWEGQTATVLKVVPMTAYHPMMQRPATPEWVCTVDRHFPACPGSPDTDDHWMAVGLREVTTSPSK